jgi:hypothetical protein
MLSVSDVKRSFYEADNVSVLLRTDLVKKLFFTRVRLIMLRKHEGSTQTYFEHVSYHKNIKAAGEFFEANLAHCTLASDPTGSPASS